MYKLSRDIKVYHDKSSQELLTILAKALEELEEFDAIMIENSYANTAVAKDYMALIDKCSVLEEEVKTLKAALDKSIQDNQLKTADIFGRSTEKMSGLVDSPLAEEMIDEDVVQPSEAIIQADGTLRKYGT